MTCERWREAISSRLDGEDPLVDERLLDAHLRRCAACRAFADDSPRLHAPMRIGPAPRIPDLSRRVRRLNRLADRAAAWGMVRSLLAVVAVQILVLSLPATVVGDDATEPRHVSRHLGAFASAYAVGLLLVVVRPARARVVLPVAGVVAGGLTITAVIDLVGGRIPWRGEMLHLPELVSVVLVWLLANPVDAATVRRKLAAWRSRRPTVVERHDVG